MKKDKQFNYNHHLGKDSLMPIPFVIDIPEGMPCYIRRIEDIVNLTEDQVNIFLKGYACNIDGTLDKKKYELAINLGFPLYVTQETFNYNPLLEDLYCARHVKPWIDENGIIRNFSYCGPTGYVLSVVEEKASLNRRFYNEKQLLSPIPFVFDIYEGMPCYIRHIEDIVNLTEDQVNIFLKGYFGDTKGSLEKRKFELAKILGVPWEIAMKTFNYDPPWFKLDCGKNVKSRVDENGIIRNFFFPGSKAVNLLKMHRTAEFNRYYYYKEQNLVAIPFVLYTSKGMPCYIRRIEDIVNLTEDQVDIFLKGYASNINGSLNKKKYELAKSIGVPLDVAKKAFNYDLTWEKLDCSCST
jgi:hypothetical protein